MARRVLDWHGPIGGNWLYFIKNRQFIGEFIRANELKPAVIRSVSVRSATPAKALIDLGIAGGIRAAHLHFNNRIYMLNSEQWASFSQRIIADSKAQLAKVKEVSFEEGILLGSVAKTLTRE